MSIAPNSLYLSDCLAMLERMSSESVSLVYLDPPWYTDVGYGVRYPHSDQKDKSIRDPESHKQESEKSFQFYLDFLWKVLQQSHRVLATRGCLFFHVEPRLSGYVRVLVDRMFDLDNFVTEIILPIPRLGNSSRPRLGHSTILFHSKTINYTYNQQTRKFTKSEIESSFKYQDEIGLFRLSSLISPLLRPNLVYQWKGVSPPVGRSWKFSQERMESLAREGLIHVSTSGMPLLKTYLHDTAEKEIGNIWDDISLRPISPERTDYSGQQTLALLTRIIRLGSNEGDVILDPFCGSGTSLVAAEKLGRKWIGCDSSKEACEITLERLSIIGQTPNQEVFNFESQIELENNCPVIFQSYEPLSDEVSSKPLSRLNASILKPNTIGNSYSNNDVDSSIQYNLNVIMDLVSAAFGDEDLSNFCISHFYSVYNQFTSGQPKSQRVRELVDHAHRFGLMEHLLIELRSANPYQFEIFKPRLH